MKRAATLAVLALAGLLARSSMPEEEPTEVHVWNYGTANRTCERWTDGCISCNRADAPVPCSNIGWGCAPSAVVCTKRAE